MGLCQYRDIFGEPNTGLHSYRIFNIAIVDVLATGALAYLISYTLSYSFVIVLILLLIVSVAMHRAFCVRTTVDKFLFPSKLKK